MGILQPAVSPISQRGPDYIKSLNLGLRPEPAVQSGGQGAPAMGFRLTLTRNAQRESDSKEQSVEVLQGNMESLKEAHLPPTSLSPAVKGSLDIQVTK